MEESKMNVKELFENEELMNNIVEDIEDIPEDSEVTYEVWALGYDKEDNIQVHPSPKRTSNNPLLSCSSPPVNRICRRG